MPQEHELPTLIWPSHQERGCGKVLLKYHKAFPSCLSWLLLQHLLGCFKPLTVFQSSGKADFDNFCLFFLCFCGGMALPSFSAIFINVTTENLCTMVLFYAIVLFYLSIQQVFVKYLQDSIHYNKHWG